MWRSGFRFLPKLLRGDDRSATARRTTLAPIEQEILLRVIGIVVVLIVVRQFGPHRNALDRRDPDAAVPDAGLAVRITRMVDESRLIPVKGRVDAGAGAENEQKRVMLGHRIVFVPAVGFSVADPFTGVFDDLRSLRDVLHGERAESVNSGGTELHPCIDRSGAARR